MRERFKKSLSGNIRKQVKAALARDAQLLRKDFERQVALFDTGMIKPSLPTKPGYVICKGKRFPAPVPDVKRALREWRSRQDA